MSLEDLGGTRRFESSTSLLSVVDKGEMSILSPVRLSSLLLVVEAEEAEKLSLELKTDDARLGDGMDDFVSVVPEGEPVREPVVATSLLLWETP